MHAVPQAVAPTADLHPAVTEVADNGTVDDALCTGSLLAPGGGGETRLPFAVEDALLREAAGEPWAVRRSCGWSSRTPSMCSQASRC